MQPPILLDIDHHHSELLRHCNDTFIIKRTPVLLHILHHLASNTTNIGLPVLFASFNPFAKLSHLILPLFHPGDAAWSENEPLAIIIVMIRKATIEMKVHGLLFFCNFPTLGPLLKFLSQNEIIKCQRIGLNSIDCEAAALK